MTKKPSFWRPVNCARKVLPQKDDLPDSCFNIPDIFVSIHMKIASSYKQFIIDYAQSKNGDLYSKSDSVWITESNEGWN